jgi:hypothetical protein
MSDIRRTAIIFMYTVGKVSYLWALVLPFCELKLIAFMSCILLCWISVIRSIGITVYTALVMLVVSMF